MLENGSFESRSLLMIGEIMGLIAESNRVMVCFGGTC